MPTDEQLKKMQQLELQENQGQNRSDDRILKFFAYDHLSPALANVSKLFGSLASHLCDNLNSGPERTVALRKLLEAKDAAVRATLYPGG